MTPVTGAMRASDNDIRVVNPARPLRPVVPGRFSIAPMIDKTDRHFRWFLRLMSKKAILYTEMITAPAVLYGKRERLLRHDPVEHPLVLQLGGDDPSQLAEAVRISEDWGYDEYNLNVGCPSDKVMKGNFGACLMAEPEKVAGLVSAMAGATGKPVTVKHRIGIQGSGMRRDSFGELIEFVEKVAAAGCERFIVHARIAILDGLSPKENRTVPPIRYQDVYELKRIFPDLHIEINGQVRDLDAAREHLEHGIDGVMFGRASYENPWMVQGIDDLEEAAAELRGHSAGSGRETFLDRCDVVRTYAAYIDRQVIDYGLNPRTLVWPLLELFQGRPGSRRYKQVLSGAYPRGVRMEHLAEEALNRISPEEPAGLSPEAIHR